MKLIRSCLLFGTLLHFQANAQEIQSTILAADSIKSGNQKDALTGFFQFAIGNLTGPGKEFTFHSNPFALMLQNNKQLAIDTNWVRYSHLRDLNFSVSVKTDSAFRIRGFAGGLKYALVNKRDVSISRAMSSDWAASGHNRELRAVQEGLADIIATITGNPDFRERVRMQVNSLLSQESSFSFVDMSPDVRQYITKMADSLDNGINEYFASHPDKNLNKYYTTFWDSLKRDYLQKPLWTVAADVSSYTDQLAVNNLTFTTQFLKGVNRGTAVTTYELDVVAQFVIRDDSLQSGRDLARQQLCFEPGINLAMRRRSDFRSYLEFKMGGGYYHTFSSLHNEGRADIVTINGELRLRVYGDIWVPVKIVYDPETGNVFGFLNVSANFTGITGLFGRRGG